MPSNHIRNLASFSALAAALLLLILSVSSISGLSALGAPAGAQSFHPYQQASSASTSQSWALGTELVPGSAPQTIEGVRIVAYMPSIPGGLGGTAFFYAEVLTVTFPNGLIFQLAVAAIPAPNLLACGAVINPCYILQYDYQSDGSTCSIDTAPLLRSNGMPQAKLWALTVYWSGSHWMYSVGYSSTFAGENGTYTLNLTEWASGQISSLNSALSPIDSQGSSYINTFDTTCTSANDQEFAAMESYDYSLTDWEKIGTIDFVPAVQYITSPSSTLPDETSWHSATAGVAVGTGLVSTDSNHNSYFGIIGSDSAFTQNLPFSPYIAGSFQSAYPLKYWDALAAGYQGLESGAQFGASSKSDLLWALPPTLEHFGRQRNSIAPGEATTLEYFIHNPNNIPVPLGLGASIMKNGGSSLVGDPANDIVENAASGYSMHYRSFATDQALTPGLYDVMWYIASGPTNATAYAMLSDSGWVSNQLNIQPLITSIPNGNPSSGMLDVGQTVKFSTSAAGGSGGYGYTWLGLPSGCISTSTAALDCTPTGAGTFKITVQVTDAYGFSVTSDSSSYLVYSDPFVNMPIASPGSTDVGQTLALSTSASGGSGGYSYLWLGLPTGCSSYNAKSIQCTPSSSGLSSISVNVRDSNGYTTTSQALQYRVYSDPTVSLPTSSALSVDTGQTVTFSIVASGGSGGYSFTWSGMPTGCGSSNSNTILCVPAGAGSFPVRASVTDSNGYAANSDTLSFKVYSDPSVCSPSASRGSADVGQSITFSVCVSGGSGGYSYQWSPLPTGCSSTNDANLACTPTGSGTFSVAVRVTDSNEYAVRSEPLSITVYSDPLVGVPMGAPGTVKVGQTVAFSVVASGGSGENSYVWSGLPTGCSTTSSDSLVCIPSGSGAFVIKVTATDSNDYSAISGGLTYNVLSGLSAGVPTPSRASVTVGESTTFVTSAYGGTGSYSYSWSGLPDGCVSANAASLVCRPTQAGTFSVAVTISDSNGDTATSGGLAFTVNPNSASNNSQQPASAISYGIYAGIAALVFLVLLGIFLFLRRRNRPA